jgi:hypothetical protein
MRLFLWLGVLAACGSDPPGGGGMDGGSVEEAVVRAIVPDVGRPDRTLDVTIAVDGLALDDTATLALGEGVTVDELDVLAGVLRARVTIAADATDGTRDVSIGAAGEVLVAPGAFRIESHLEATITGARGQVVELAIENRDSMGLYPPHLFEGVWIVRQDEASATHWRGMVIVDPLAPTSTAIGMRNTSRTFEPLAHFVAAPVPIGDGVTIERTVSSELTELRDQVIANPGDTVVYALTTPAPGVLRMALGTLAGNPLRPHVSVVPPSGTFQDLIQDRATTSTMIHAPVAGTYYVIVRDANLGGGPAYTFTFLARFETVTSVTETATAHATTATAQSVSGLVEGTLAAGDVQDVYRVPGTSFITLQTDADLELEILSLDGSSLFTMETSRPFDRTATYSNSASSGMALFVVVRSRSGNVGRPTGAYTLAVN